MVFMALGARRTIKDRRGIVSILAAIFLVLSSVAMLAPSHAATPAPAQAVQHHHDGAADVGTHHHPETTQTDVKGTCGDHHKAQGHGGTCCKITCHAAIPALALPVTAPQQLAILASRVPVADAPHRTVFIDRPPRVRA